MLVGQVQGSTGDGQGKHGGDHCHAAPMGLIFREQRSRKTPAAKDDQRDAAKLPKELGYAYGEAGPVDKAGNPFIEESGLKLNAEKLRIVGIKSRVQIALYSGKIDTVILDTWVVA